MGSFFSFLFSMLLFWIQISTKRNKMKWNLNFQWIILTEQNTQKYHESQQVLLCTKVTDIEEIRLILMEFIFCGQDWSEFTGGFKDKINRWCLIFKFREKRFSSRKSRAKIFIHFMLLTVSIFCFVLWHWDFLESSKISSPFDVFSGAFLECQEISYLMLHEMLSSFLSNATYWFNRKLLQPPFKFIAEKIYSYNSNCPLMEILDSIRNQVKVNKAKNT
jgi:hypothetical protein